MEAISIDVRDLDYTWFENVKAFIDRETNQYLFPRESAERLGEFDEDTGDYRLIDGHVTAGRLDLEQGGTPVPVWAVGLFDLPVRPAASNS